ncbi:MAG: CHAD domain-containing protein [Methanoregula sp.]|jgi:CHAD domain-containing protein|nr:CHAD domain-containing protein [Methanoregula sp.]
MMQPNNPPVAITGLCWFMLRRLPPLVEAFAREIDGVRASEDIEYIHRMRVASRRLRAALPLFSSCFSQKQYNRWMVVITGITRALGEARDADVQIAFLQKYQKKQVTAWQKHHGGNGPEPPAAPAIRYLLMDLRKRRSRYQQQIISELDALDKSRIIPGMREAFSLLSAGHRRIPRQELAYGIPSLAAYRIETRLATLLSYEPWVSSPDAVAEHHATRIAAKKLRYTMEIYAPVYRLGLAKPHARVKKIQDILGDLHDCDVWIDQITRLLLRERSHFRSDNREKRPGTGTLASLKVFLQDRENERIILHRRFRHYWESLLRIGIWDELRTTLVHRRRNRFIPLDNPDAAEIRSAVNEFTAPAPEYDSHVRLVTNLSLMLFDGMQPLHGLDSRARLLLECTGMLHDVGWSGGRKKHHIRGADAILAAETLPFDIGERVILALAVFSHRGRRSPEDYPLYSLLSPEQCKIALQLSAILRAAEGFDHQHLGPVREIQCVTGKTTVVCTIAVTGEAAAEPEPAGKRADLFFRAFGRDLVVQ